MTLTEYLEREKEKPAAFARRIKRSRSTVSRLLRGLCEPDPDTARAIIRETRGKVGWLDLMRAG